MEAPRSLSQNSAMDTKKQQQPEGAGHQQRAERLAEWLVQTNYGRDLSVAGSVDADAYVLPSGWMTRRQAE